MMHIVMKSQETDLTLLMFAGLVRDRMPWLSEVLTETQRELKTATPDQARKMGMRLMNAIKFTTRGFWAEWVIGRSKSGYIILKELPNFVERAIAQKIDSFEHEDLLGNVKKDDVE
ncbi:MAG: hypothetical protein ACK4HW_10075 [Roseinatronobacter sp.]